MIYRWNSFRWVAVLFLLGANAWCDNWVGNYSYLSDRNPQGVCAPSAGAGMTGNSIQYTEWDRERAVLSNFCFEVYVKGLTDQQQLNPGSLDVFVYAPYKFPARFVSKTGNNYRYVVSVKDLDPLLHGTSASGNTKDDIRVKVQAETVDGYHSPCSGEPVRVRFVR